MKPQPRRLPDKEGRALERLRNEAGVSITETLVVLAIFGFLAFISLTSIGPLLGLSDRVGRAASEDLELTLGLQAMRAQLTRSSITRTPMISCSLPAPLSTSSASSTAAVVAKNGSFTIPYNDLRSLGAVEASSSEHRIKVGSTDTFAIGQILHVRTLNAQNLEGLYRIRSINQGANRLVVEPFNSQPPTTFGCTLQSPSTVTNLIFPSSGATTQISISRLRLVSYRIDGERKLLATHWPADKDLSQTRTDMIREGVEQIHISQKFAASSDNKGSYLARITADVSAAGAKNVAGISKDRKTERVVMDAEYVLAGLDVQNEMALPEPPSVESIALSCSLGVTIIRDYYVPDAGVYPVSVYQLEMVPSDNGLIGSSSAPQAIVTLSTADDPAIPKPRCWRESETANLPSSLGLLKRLVGPGSESGTSLGRPSSPTATNPLERVYCTIQDQAKLQSSLKFLLNTGGWLQWKTINCTPTTVEGTGSERWAYDVGMESACDRDGSVFIGRLIREGTISQAGPELSLKPNGCTWTGTSSTSCNAAQVLDNTPSAELRSVQLIPDDLHLNITTNYPTLNCN